MSTNRLMPPGTRVTSTYPDKPYRRGTIIRFDAREGYEIMWDKVGKEVAWKNYMLDEVIEPNEILLDLL